MRKILIMSCLFVVNLSAETAYLVNAIKHGNLRAVQYALERGADVNERLLKEGGKTPLMISFNQIVHQLDYRYAQARSVLKVLGGAGLIVGGTILFLTHNPHDYVRKKRRVKDQVVPYPLQDDGHAEQEEGSGQLPDEAAGVGGDISVPSQEALRQRETTEKVLKRWKQQGNTSTPRLRRADGTSMSSLFSDGSQEAAGVGQGASSLPTKPVQVSPQRKEQVGVSYYDRASNPVEEFGVDDEAGSSASAPNAGGQEGSGPSEGDDASIASDPPKPTFRQRWQRMKTKWRKPHSAGAMAAGAAVLAQQARAVSPTNRALVTLETRMEIFRLLLNQPDIDLKIKDGDGKTVPCYVCRYLNAYENDEEWQRAMTSLKDMIEAKIMAVIAQQF